MNATRVLVTASITLIVGTLLSAILATVILDTLLERPVAASVTTLLPGSVYATATVMKVCIVAGLVSAVIALMTRLSGLGTNGEQSAPSAPKHVFPIWGVLSITFAPLTPFLGGVAAMMAQVLISKQTSLSLSDLSQVSRTAVFVQLALISLGAISALTSLLRRERPRLLPVLGLVANSVLIGLFLHLEFYAAGFDQDTWAPR